MAIYSINVLLLMLAFAVAACGDITWNWIDHRLALHLRTNLAFSFINELLVPVFPIFSIFVQSVHKLLLDTRQWPFLLWRLALRLLLILLLCVYLRDFLGDRGNEWLLAAQGRRLRRFTLSLRHIILHCAIKQVLSVLLFVRVLAEVYYTLLKRLQDLSVSYDSWR